MGKFHEQMKRATAKASRNANLARKKIAFDLMELVIKETPRDTGRAAGNWLPSIGTPRSGTIGVISESNAIAGLRTTVELSQPDESIYLTNNLPYIRRLEYEGHSPQKPHGFVRLAVQRFDLISKRVARQINK